MQILCEFITFDLEIMKELKPAIESLFFG